MFNKKYISDFLPKGGNMVTKAPIVISLHSTSPGTGIKVFLGKINFFPSHKI